MKTNPGVLPATLSGAVTGIGSLPFLSADEAVRAVAEYSDEVPFWPQLPQVSDRETVIGQGLGVLAGLIEPRTEGYGYEVKAGRIDAVVAALHNSSGSLTADRAAGFPAFEHAVATGAFPRALALKGQIEGPVTLATYLFYRGRAFLADASLFSAVVFHVAQMVSWQIGRLKAFAKPVLLFVDEPGLCLDAAVPGGISQERRWSAVAAIFDDVRAHGAFGGLHCCAAHPFDRMCAAAPDMISFDAHHGLEQFLAHRGALRFIERGGWVAYGMVPTASEPITLPAASLFSRWLVAASMAGDPKDLAQRAMVTATCGLGLLDGPRVQESFALAHRVGSLLRRLAGVETAESTQVLQA
ncbi:MAG: hypothetical protein C5B56_11260 [Proteobacteria bacterium]|nr:MAG: hypothetical protein C5B56_11260 [Pseudomonadota bacterium]